MYEKIRFWIKKLLSLFSIFIWGKSEEPEINQEIFEQVKTYNESNLSLLLNSYAFIESMKKTPKEEINEYSASFDEALKEIFKPLCDIKDS